MADRAQRAHIARIMDLLVQNEPKVHYPPHDVRIRSINEIDTDAELLAELHAGRLTIDCSQSATLLCHVAGLRDPNGQRYRQDGFTGTQSKYLTHYTNPKNANIGAFVFFGPYPHEHVCQVRRPGANPLLFSMGQERGPIFISLAAERTFHSSPVVFGSIAKL